MFGGLGELAKLVLLMNDEGHKLMVEAAKDITGREKFRNEGLSPEKLFRQFDEAVAMGNSWKETGVR